MGAGVVSLRSLFIIVLIVRIIVLIIRRTAKWKKQKNRLNLSFSPAKPG